MIEKKLVDWGLNNESSLKFQDLPEIYNHENARLERKKKIEKIEDKVKRAYDKNKFLGFIVKNYYEIFSEAYFLKKKEERMSHEIFKSVMKLD